jgi:hypothetical protein
MLSFLRKLFADRPTTATPNGFRPQVSVLESREVPAVNVAVVGGTLTISDVPGQPRGEILLRHEDALWPGPCEGGCDGIAVYEGGVRRTYPQPVGALTGVQVDLRGTQADRVVAGGSYLPRLTVNLGDGAGQSVEVSAGTRVGGDLTVSGTGAYVDVRGAVSGAVAVNTTSSTAFSWNNYVTVYSSGSVGGNLTVGRSDLLGGQVGVSVEGRVNGNLTVYGSSVGDVVLVNTGAVVGGGMTVRTGGGNDFVFAYGTVGANAGSQSTDLRTGDGNDRVEVGGSARLESFSALLEGGNDTFVLSSGASFSSMLVGGGAGTDSFFGVRTLPNLWLGTFEVFG